MSDDDNRLRESLSALVDGAADELEVQRVLKATAEDTELRAIWDRYQMARAAMRDDLPTANTDLSGAISDAIASEPVYGRGADRYFRSFARVAVAASVAVAVILGVQQFNRPDAGGTPVIAGNGQSSNLVPTPPAFGRPPIETAPVSTSVFEPLDEPLLELDEASRRRLETHLSELMKRHTDGAALGGSQGMLPFARLPGEAPEKSE